jgi:16S rRNA G966 N2-methylase RsmD
MNFNILKNYSEDDSDLSNDNKDILTENELDNEIDNELENEIKYKPKNKEHLKNIFNYEYNLDDEDDDKSNKYDKYVEPIILENVNVFPFFKKEDIEKASNSKKLLKITDKGKYSISKPCDAEWITNIICNFSINILKKHPNTQIITDGTAGIGGNVIDFSKHFLQVNAVEINKVHYEVLKNNVEAIDLKNVKTYNDNFLNFVDLFKYQNSIFFIDPPWGGKSYKNFKYFNLKLGKIMIYDVINILFKKGYKYVFLKAPINLNVSPILSSSLYSNYNIHKNINGNMLLIIFY